MNKLNYQEPENTCDLEKSDPPKLEKHNFSAKCVISHAKC